MMSNETFGLNTGPPSELISPSNYFVSYSRILTSIELMGPFSVEHSHDHLFHDLYNSIGQERQALHIWIKEASIEVIAVDITGCQYITN